MAVPWLRRLVAGLSPRRPGFDPGSVHVGFAVDKVALGQVFRPSTSVYPCQFHSTCAPLQGKTKRLIIFITELHNKPRGCGASVASTAGLLTNKQKSTLFYKFTDNDYHITALLDIIRDWDISVGITICDWGQRIAVRFPRASSRCEVSESVKSLWGFRERQIAVRFPRASNFFTSANHPTWFWDVSSLLLNS
jgi:hypothetical protein